MWRYRGVICLVRLGGWLLRVGIQMLSDEKWSFRLRGGSGDVSRLAQDLRFLNWCNWISGRFLGNLGRSNISLDPSVIHRFGYTRLLTQSFVRSLAHVLSYHWSLLARYTSFLLWRARLPYNFVTHYKHRFSQIWRRTSLCFNCFNIVITFHSPLSTRLRGSFWDIN